ncbi:MAG TPA: hypothetical protein VGA31_09040 [Thermoanaerobaculia bacterium]
MDGAGGEGDTKTSAKPSQRKSRGSPGRFAGIEVGGSRVARATTTAGFVGRALTSAGAQPSSQQGMEAPTAWPASGCGQQEAQRAPAGAPVKAIAIATTIAAL